MLVKKATVLSDTWQAFYNSFNNSLLTPYTETNNDRCLNIANIYDIKLQKPGTGGDLRLYKNGTQIYGNSGYAGGGYTNGNLTVVASDENFIYFILYGVHTSGYYYRSVLILYDKVGDLILTGARGVDTNIINPLNTLPITDSTSSRQFVLSPTLNYSAELNKIECTKQRLFENSQITAIEDPHFRSCSIMPFAVEQATVASFDGKNYYIAGPSILIEMNNT